MPLRPADVRPGMYVAVTGYRGTPPVHPFTGLPVEMSFDGRPLEVVAVSLPFVGVCWWGRHLSAIDTREYELVAVRPQYARAMGNMRTRTHKKKARDHSPPEAETGRCVNCGERMRRVMGKGTGYRWRWRCPQCGADGGPEGVTT